mgnify:CR=1 FL=1
MKRLGKNTGNRGATLLEVVIVVGVMGIFLTAAYQFLILMNARTRSHIADQELNDRINLFFNMMAKDFRTARRVTIVENSGRYTVDIITVDGKRAAYVFQEDRILRNNIAIVQGIIGVNIGYVKATPVPGGRIPFTFYSELHISVSTPRNNYDLSVVRRNPPEGDE